MGQTLFLPLIRKFAATDFSFFILTELQEQLKFLNPPFSLDNNKWRVSKVVGNYSQSKEIIEKQLEKQFEHYFEEHKRTLKEAKIDINKMNDYAFRFISKILVRDILEKIFGTKSEPIQAYSEEALPKHQPCFSPEDCKKIKSDFFEPFSPDTLEKAEQTVLTDKLHTRIMACITDKVFFDLHLTNAMQHWKKESDQFKSEQARQYMDASERYEAIRKSKP